MPDTIPLVEEMIEDVEQSIKKLKLMKDCFACSQWKHFGDSPKKCAYYIDGEEPRCIRRKRERELDADDN